MLYFAHSFISDHVAIDNYYCKTLIGPKPLRIRFDKTDGFIRIYDGTRYLVLFGPEKYYAVHNIIMLKSGQRKVTKENFHAAEKPIKIWNIHLIL